MLFFYNLKLWSKGIGDKVLAKMITEEEYRMPDPQPYFEEKTSIFYENVIAKCWTTCYVMRPTFKELEELFLTYFDVYEPNYVFPKLSKNYEQTSDVLSTDLVNLGVLVQSGNFSEIWKSNFFIQN